MPSGQPVFIVWLKACLYLYWIWQKKEKKKV